jgi:hypothetical protein
VNSRVANYDKNGDGVKSGGDRGIVTVCASGLYGLKYYQ